MKINNVLIFILLITLFVFFMRMYKEGMKMDSIDYNKEVAQKNDITDKITKLETKINNKDYSIYNTETAAIAKQQSILLIIIGILALVVFLFTIKYVIS